MRAIGIRSFHIISTEGADERALRRSVGILSSDSLLIELGFVLVILDLVCYLFK